MQLMPAVNKRLILREELQQADADEFTEYGVEDLPELAAETEREAMTLLKPSASKLSPP
jgi:hypothetical protein